MTPKRQVRRITIYTRVSFIAKRTGGKSADEETSTDRQEERIRAAVVAKGWDSAEVHAFNDRGVSAFHDRERRGWAKVVQAVESESTDVVMVFALDRAERNAVRLLQFANLCKEHGVALVSVTQDIDTSGPYGLVILAVLAAVAEVESTIKRERARSKHIEMAEAGRYAGSYRPFGYTRDMVQVPAEVAAIRAGAEALLNGASLQSVANAWNAAGLKTTPGNPFKTTTVRRVLENPIYAGVREYNGREYAGAWEPVFTKSTARKIANRLAENDDGVARRSSRYLLTGLLICGICGKHMVGRPSKGVRRYICIRSGKNHLGIASERVEDYVGDMASIMLVKKMLVRDPATLSAPLQARLEKAEAKLAAFARNAAEAGMSAAEIREGRAPIVAERDRAAAELDSLAEKKPAPAILIKKTADRRYADEWAAMIAARVDRVIVQPVGRGGNQTPVEQRVKIVWRDGVVPANVAR